MNLREALDADLIGFDGYGNVTLPREAFEAVHAAGRRFLALTETGRRQWCVLHEAPVWNVASGECIGAHHMTPAVPCEIVPAHIVLADYLTEDSPP